MVTKITIRSVLLALLTTALSSLALPANFTSPAQAQYQSQRQGLIRTFPEQHNIQVRGPEQLPTIALPETQLPFTVSTKIDNRNDQRISLDEAIQLAVKNAEIVRVLGGVTAGSSGRTIYDVAISNTAIDLQTAVFDPQLDITSTMNKSDRPGAVFDVNNPGESILVGSSTDSINTTVNLSKRTFNGATAGINANWVGSYFEPGIFPLEPEYRSGVEMSLRQPMMRGFGRDVNLAPVVIARIDTERSYFQFKASVQELVRGVINAYWNLVAARIEVWARKQQAEQTEFAFKRATARQEEGLAKAGEVAQARSAFANFKASLIAARSSEILAETALRNILGLPPSNISKLIPTSTPVLEKVDFNWNEVVSIAEQYRPDIIEIKLVLEADKLALMQADNQALPQFDGIANYRWDGLSGEMPNGALLRNDGGRFAGFNLGVNFSVPLGLRQARASLRRRELIIAQDQANLDQQVHQMVHQLTLNYRNLDQFFEQYVAFKEAREAALINFKNQFREVEVGSVQFINLLQAISDWGNSVSQEARSITQYNTELANVERQTGTILETHGIRFVEEQYGSIGPRGILGVIRKANDCYPAKTRIEGGTDRYPESGETSDDAFNLQDLVGKRDSRTDGEEATDALERTRQDNERQRDLDSPTLDGLDESPPNLDRSSPGIERPSPEPDVSFNRTGKPLNDASANVGSFSTPPARVSRKRNRIFGWLR